MTTTDSALFGVAAGRWLGGRVATGTLAAALISLLFAVLTWLVVVGFAPLVDADRAVVDAVNARMLTQPLAVQVFEVLALVTHPNAMRALAAVVALVLWTRGQRRVVGWLAVTMGVGGLLSPAIKVIVARPRPIFINGVSGADGYAFPSGHALNSMLLAACLVILVHPLGRRPVRVVLWAAVAALVVVTGIDRIALGVHYPSDVLGGWLVALATVCVTTAAFAAWQSGLGSPRSTRE